MPIEESAAASGRALTYGEMAVGLTFNPSGDATVSEIKKDYAKIIDCLNHRRDTAIINKETEKIRLYSIAITEAQAAQMWAVKALTFNS